jgi:hypothetical protein
MSVSSASADKCPSLNIRIKRPQRALIERTATEDEAIEDDRGKIDPTILNQQFTNLDDAF